MKLTLIISMIVFATLLTCQKVVACECYSASSCEHFGDSKAVFVGQVVEGKSPDRMSDMLALGTGKLKFVFDVIRPYKGVKLADQIEVYTGKGFGDCGFPFNKGESYLVYAYEQNGKLETSICSGSRSLSDVAEDEFSFLSSVRAHKWDGGRLNGNVYTLAGRRPQGIQDVWIPAQISLRLSQGSNSRILQANEKGDFQIDGLNESKYLLEPILSEYYALDRSSYALDASLQNWEAREFQLSSGGCKQENFNLVNNSRIAGRVTGADRVVMAKARVQMIPVGRPDKIALEEYEYYEGETDAVGNYVITAVPPGKYYLGVNLASSPDRSMPYKRTYYPGRLDRDKAQIIEVGLGQKINGLDLQLTQGVRQASVSGVLTFSNGKPARDVGITLEDVNHPGLCVNGCDIRTDSTGKFHLTGYVGYTYFVKAYDVSEAFDAFDQETVSTPAKFTLMGDLQGLKVVLIKKPKKK